MIHFHDEAHRQKVVHYLQKDNRVYPDSRADSYYLPALYLLLSTKNDLYKKIGRYIDSDGIDFEKMLSKQDFPSSERKLIKLAANLFNGSMEVSPSELIDTLDDENFTQALQAIFLKRTSCHVKELLPAAKEVPEPEPQYDLKL
ncbi:DUF6075 family protein [Dehalobacter sp.]|uniref:DUF6075 family protein n=1 Tax=Dehalobacter sp. TaxID=1962289 RepID=UPI002590AFF5|nr:DUF6075 family protein [Dehalobacter sp.]MDJ0305641.1 DUF6075 family protein [Dehalobacter sp.]